jgi:hypothetical protein
MNYHRINIAIIIALSAIVLLATGCDKIKNATSKINIPGNVAGQVLTKDGAPLAYISIQLVDVATNKVVEGQTVEDNGNFMFNKVTAGEYTLKTYQTGEVEIPNDCQPFKVGAGKTVSKNIVADLAAVATKK